MVSPGRKAIPAGAVVCHPNDDDLSTGIANSAKGPISRILSCAVIPLGAALTRTLISDLPGGFGVLLTAAPCRAGYPQIVQSRLGASGRCAAEPGSWLALPSLFGLAPCGVYPASVVTGGAVRSYRTISPLPEDWPSRHCPSDQLCPCRGTSIRRYVFCGTGRPWVLRPTSRKLSGTLPCGVRTFLPRLASLARTLPAATARSSCQSLV